MQPCYLVVEPPQLREMLLAIESTEVAEQDQDRGASDQLARREDLVVNRQEIEIELDAHPTMMRSTVDADVTPVTESLIIATTIGRV